MAYTAYGWLLQSGTSSVVVSTYAYVNPAIAVVLGWLFAGETVGGREIAAGAVILSSVGMLVLARAPRAKTKPSRSHVARPRPQFAPPVPPR